MNKLYYNLDLSQQKLLKTNKNAIVIAGAGTGKTTTIIGKINYLIENQKCHSSEILVISFTNASVNDIKKRINYNVNVFTFHKLAINILNMVNFEYSLCNENFLKYIINETLVNLNKNDIKKTQKFLHINYNYKEFLYSYEFQSFKNIIFTFINLFKANDLKYHDLKKIRYKKNEKKVLLIIFKIYNRYIQEKRSINKLDFDDLINYATKLVNKTSLNYKYIIIDEFQDTSLIRFNLIKNIQKKCNSRLIVVGDDWQSIYRFSGCDLNIFLNFQKHFPESTKIYLQNTYRNSQELINIASKFITKNPLQIKKKLCSNKNQKNPIIFVPYKNEKSILKDILNKLENENNIMIISRNNHDILNYIDDEFTFEDNILIYKSKTIKYYSIHKSKGLEADIVIILNCNSNKFGIPNKIENNILIEKTFKNNEIKYAEERRLFYVALTRTKNEIYLLYNKNYPSIFIKEIKKLIKEEKKEINYFD